VARHGACLRCGRRRRAMAVGISRHDLPVALPAARQRARRRSRLCAQRRPGRLRRWIPAAADHGCIVAGIQRGAARADRARALSPEYRGGGQCALCGRRVAAPACRRHRIHRCEAVFALRDPIARSRDRRAPARHQQGAARSGRSASATRSSCSSDASGGRRCDQGALLAIDSSRCSSSGLSTPRRFA
jgi:hypothetical protein